MSLKLNLGAGTFPLPYERDHEPNAEHVLPLPDECYEQGWINVDKFALPGIQETINLFRFPWIRSSNGNPFNDNSVDCIFASHFVEHIPHEVKVNDHIPLGWREYAEYVENYDGFFVFFAECYRILKPDGVIYIRAPYGVSYDALCDPTHTRRIVPGSFSYLSEHREENKPFDYRLDMHFEQHGPVMWRMPAEEAQVLKYYTDEGFQNRVRLSEAHITGFDMAFRAVK